jgi:hypothetical protein
MMVNLNRPCELMIIGRMIIFVGRKVGATYNLAQSQNMLTESLYRSRVMKLSYFRIPAWCILQDNNTKWYKLPHILSTRGCI